MRKHLFAALPLAPPADASSGAAHGRFWIAVSALVFAAMAVATRAVTHELAAAQIALIRLIIGLAGVAMVACWRPRLFQATRFRGLALRGVLGGTTVLGYFLAIERLGAGLGTLLNYTFPLWASVFGAFFLGERLGSRVVVGMLIATAGLVVVVGPADLQRAWQGLGDRSIQVGLAAGLTSGVIGGAATTTVRALRRTESALAIFGAFCAFGILVCAPMAWRDWRPVFSHAAWLLLLIGTLSFCAQMLFTYSLKFVTAGAGSLMTQLTVVASYSFAALFLGEAIQLHALVGGLVVMAGVLLVSLGSGVTPARSTVLPASAEVE